MFCFIRNLFCSSLGRKYLMALTGAVMVLFVLGHLAGNLQIFIGPDQINAYGHFLQSNLEIIWPARIVLLACLLLHIWSAAALTRDNLAARPVNYAHWEPTAATYASRTMVWSGVIVAVFILYHLLHYTVMAQAPSLGLTGRDFHSLLDDQKRHDIYRMMILGFSNRWVSLFYIVGVGLLCLHLSHGASAMWQSLGWKKNSYSPLLDGLARWGSLAVFLGYISIPLAVWFKVIR
ncbi:MAG: succinate dehydrogenase cytochrome b subunit [Verrucomicrobiota bacterium]